MVQVSPGHGICSASLSYGAYVLSDPPSVISLCLIEDVINVLFRAMLPQPFTYSQYSEQPGLSIHHCFLQREALIKVESGISLCI